MENQLKTTTEEQQPQPEEQESRKGKLSLSDVDRYIKYLLFVVLIGLVYVWNSHFAEKQLRREAQLKKEINDARAEYKTMQSRLSTGTRKSVLASKVDTLGIHILRTPPYKIKKKK